MLIAHIVHGVHGVVHGLCTGLHVLRIYCKAGESLQCLPHGVARMQLVVCMEASDSV